MIDNTTLLIEQLATLNGLLKEQLETRNPVRYMVQISTTMPWNIDYKDRKHVYIYSPNAITLSSTDIGNMVIPAAAWVMIDLPEGLRVFSNQQAFTYIHVYCTDEVLPVANTALVSANLTNPSMNGIFTVADPGSALATRDLNMLWNGANWDSFENNIAPFIVLTSGSFGVGTNNTGPLTNYNGRGLFVFLNITAIGTGTAQLSIQVRDIVTGNYVTILQDAFAIGANGEYLFIVYPGITPVTSTSATVPGSGFIRTAVSQPVGRIWQASVTVATAAVTMGINAGQLL